MPCTDGACSSDSSEFEWPTGELQLMHDAVSEVIAKHKKIDIELHPWTLGDEASRRPMENRQRAETNRLANAVNSSIVEGFFVAETESTGPSPLGEHGSGIDSLTCEQACFQFFSGDDALECLRRCDEGGGEPPPDRVAAPEDETGRVVGEEDPDPYVPDDGWGTPETTGGCCVSPWPEFNYSQTKGVKLRLPRGARNAGEAYIPPEIQEQRRAYEKQQRSPLDLGDGPRVEKPKDPGWWEFETEAGLRIEKGPDGNPRRDSIAPERPLIQMNCPAEVCDIPPCEISQSGSVYVTSSQEFFDSVNKALSAQPGQADRVSKEDDDYEFVEGSNPFKTCIGSMLSWLDGPGPFNGSGAIDFVTTFSSGGGTGTCWFSSCSISWRYKSLSPALRPVVDWSEKRCVRYDGIEFVVRNPQFSGWRM